LLEKGLIDESIQKLLDRRKAEVVAKKVVADGEGPGA
jgi:hypothetical protein